MHGDAASLAGLHGAEGQTVSRVVADHQLFLQQNRMRCLYGEMAVFANIRWEVVLALMGACVVSVVVGLVLWMWAVWIISLLGLLVIVGDIAWTIMSFARAKRAGESKLKF